jgi:hypothetical protein
MALSPPSSRTHIHTRQVACQGFRRTDGLWDIEGHLTDVKTYAFSSIHRGEIHPGEPVHDLWLRLTITDTFKVVAIEAATAQGPFHICGDITPAFQQLVGLTIGAGWTRAIKERLGGAKGCTHLVELLGPVATTAFQTIYPILVREQAERPQADPAGSKIERPVLLDTCHVFDSAGDFVREHWPEHYTGPVSPIAEGI